MTSELSDDAIEDQIQACENKAHLSGYNELILMLVTEIKELRALLRGMAENDYIRYAYGKEIRDTLEKYGESSR